MELREMKGGGQSWGHIGVSPIWKSQPCYQGGSSTAGGINVKFWAGTRRGQSFEDICTLQEELEEREGPVLLELWQEQMRFSLQFSCFGIVDSQASDCQMVLQV